MSPSFPFGHGIQLFRSLYKKRLTPWYGSSVPVARDLSRTSSFLVACSPQGCSSGPSWWGECLAEDFFGSKPFFGRFFYYTLSLPFLLASLVPTPPKGPVGYLDIPSNFFSPHRPSSHREPSPFSIKNAAVLFPLPPITNPTLPEPDPVKKIFSF